MIILEYLLMFLLIIVAFMIAFFKEELNSIIALSIFSIILSVLYLLYQAPDLSLTEAVIGAGLNTAIFITAISQVRSKQKSPYREDKDK